MAKEWEASDEEKLQIAQRFLLASPPGQFYEVLRDIEKLVPGHILSDTVRQSVLHAYNIKNFLPVEVPDADYKILICEEGEIDDAHYIDPIGNRVLEFEKERQQVQQTLRSYLQFEYMHGGTAGVYVVGTKLIVNLCTERVNLRNFWGGRWKSRWEVDLTVNPATVKGTIQLHVHYFENGNLQLQSVKDIEEEITIQSPGNLGDAILRVMKEAEDNLQMNLEDMYSNMSEETFKEMRRVMPVTQAKMEWSLYAHRTAKDLGRSK
ncbi:unnamed protein product [Peronospora belbahrii]|uniref:F-actin-capping protein subunit alpha n=1 Tax=Peronospora belbahrii TaxID=622444 RepID=A0ABN8CLY5_9STRA|nr:unnamed protein product [Peronospora belbahrii]